MSYFEWTAFILGNIGICLALVAGILYFADLVLSKILHWKKIYWGFCQMVCFPDQWKEWLKKCEGIYGDKQQEENDSHV